ncbi:MAG: PTS sugar transporter subunit IIA [Candidatus Binatia bacterium]
MKVRDILDRRRITLELDGSSKDEILRQLSASLKETHPSLDNQRLVEALIEREKASTTAIADGIAIPHGKIAMGEEVIACFGRSREGLDFASVDGSPTKLFFLLVSPESHPSLHLRWLAHIAHLLNDPLFRDALLDANGTDGILDAIHAAELRAIEEEPPS